MGTHRNCTTPNCQSYLGLVSQPSAAIQRIALVTFTVKIKELGMNGQSWRKMFGLVLLTLVLGSVGCSQSLQIEVRYADTLKPVVGAQVTASQAGVGPFRDHALVTTNNRGVAWMSLRSSYYHMSIYSSGVSTRDLNMCSLSFLHPEETNSQKWMITPQVYPNSGRMIEVRFSHRGKSTGE